MSTLPTSSPYISVVVSARNDDHGGNMIGRMQAFLDAWLAQARRYDLPSEIIVVEWNPPLNRSRLIGALQWPQGPQPCAVRFIEVPEAIHRRFANADKIPLQQMIAKNVGIRRARGEFVLATNLDIIFSAELMRYLAERGLERRTLYRIDRHDVSSGIPRHATADELLTFCQNHMLRVFTAEGKTDLEPGGARRLEPLDIVPPGVGIDLGAGWYSVETYPPAAAPFRWIASEAEVILRRPRESEGGLFLDVEVGPSAKDGVLTLEVVDERNSVLAATSVEGRSTLRLHIPAHLSSASIRLRPQCQRVPLASDLHFLCLRVYGLCWEDSPWHPLLPPQAARLEREPTIRVRACGPRQLQVVIRAGEDAALESLALGLTDAAGETLFRAENRIEPLGEGLLTLDVGFRFAGVHAEHRSPGTGWFLEALKSLPGTDWNASNQRVSPFASDMRDPAYLHTNGCGDFTLLARQDWWDLRGYAEFPIWPEHVDSILCYAAHHAGIRQRILCAPMRIFHIEHKSGAGWTPEGERERIGRIEAKGVGLISHSDSLKWIDQMRRLNAPVILNQEYWGLADLDLQETAAPAGDFRCSP